MYPMVLFVRKTRRAGSGVEAPGTASEKKKFGHILAEKKNNPVQG